MAWTFQLIDRAGSPLGELRNATNRSLRFPLAKTPTVTFSVQADNPFAPLFLTDDKILLKAYEDTTTPGTKTLRFLGPCVGHQKQRQSGGGSIAVTAAGLQWRLDHRLIGKSVAGTTFGTTSLSLLDRGEMLGRIIDALNAGEASNIFADAGDTGIRRGTIAASSSTYVSWHYKPAGEAFGDLTGTLDGPDWEIAPVEPTADATGVKMGVLNVAPAIGSTKPDIAFVFGAPPYNVAEWTDIGDSTTLANRAVNLPPGFSDNATQLPTQWDNTPSITDRGLYEAVVSADVQTDDLRLKLVQQHAATRGVPKRLIGFTPVAESSSVAAADRRVPRPFSEYIVGDVVRFRAVEKFSVFDTSGTVIGTTDTPTVDVLMRVFVIQIDLDDAGTASTALILQEDS